MQTFQICNVSYKYVLRIHFYLKISKFSYHFLKFENFRKYIFLSIKLRCKFYKQYYEC